MLRMKYVWTLTLAVMLAALASSVAFATPWTALQYEVPLSVTSVPVPNDFTEASFDDVATDFWAWAEIEEAAGAHTASSDFIVQGYGGGLYEPTWQVTRAQMAVFIARGAGLTADAPADPTFGDVGADYWAFTEIEQCVDAGVVQGYADYFGPGLPAYLPTVVVDRAQMAVFIQRAAGLTTVPYVADTFSDVDDTFWAATEIQACVDANIVKGYDDGTYLPDVAVTRAQMAVFVWRSLVRYTGGDVVLGGPAVSDDAWLVPAGGEGEAQLFLPTDVGTATGANTTEIVDDEEVDLPVEPGAVVFIVLDAVQVGAGDIVFEVSHVEVDDNGTPADDSDDFDVTVVDDTATLADVATGADADVETADGVPYMVASYQIDSTLVAEDYTLTITLPGGNVQALDFTVAAP